MPIIVTYESTMSHHFGVLPPCLHHYADGYMTLGEVVDDFDTTTEAERDAVIVEDRWMQSVRVMDSPDEEMPKPPPVNAELLDQATQVKLEIVIEGTKEFKWLYVKATGVLTYRARGEHTITWAEHRFLLNEYRQFLELLP